MPKINVYLPDELAAAVRDARLSVSPICQQALAEAVRAVREAREAIAVIRDPDFDPLHQPQISIRIATRMTPHLRQALQLARDLAGSRGLVETEHLLLGVIDEPDNLGVHLMQSLGVDILLLRDAAEHACGRTRRAGTRRSRAKRSRSTLDTDGQCSGEELLGGLSSTARSAIAGALEAAIDLGHNYLGCEHLVLALADEPGGATAELLSERQISPARIREAIPAAVAAAALGYRNARHILSPSVADQLGRISRRLDEFERRLEAHGM